MNNITAYIHMLKKQYGRFLLFIAIIFFTACNEESHDTGADSSTYDHIVSRSFRMGFTPQAFTGVDFAASIDTAYDLINRHGDIVALHLAEGVPWNEALSGSDWQTWHVNAQQIIQRHKDNLNRYPDLPVFLSLSPLNGDRTGLAGYWADDAQMDLSGFSGGWDTKTFNDPDVVQAYLNFVIEMVQELDPDYLAYAIEVTSMGDLKLSGDPQYAHFIQFLDQLYTQLKANLTIPVFISFLLLDNDHWENYRTVHDDLIAYTDWVTVSTYPYMRAWPLNSSDAGDPSTMESDWFSKVTAAYPGKPFAIVETGFLAEDLSIFTPDISGGSVPPVDEWNYELVASGTPANQKLYIHTLLTAAYKQNARMVIWFVPVDYDAMWDTLYGDLNPVVPWFDAFKQWRDTGLWDGSGGTANDPGQPRVGLGVWDIFLGKPLQ